MKIGPISLRGRAILAPMAGISDQAFRQLCTRFGAAYVISEMVSSKGLQYSSRKGKELMALSEHERPAAIQIFGDDPAVMAQAAQTAMTFSPQAIDINMGCPAPKISNNGGGCALMKTPALCGDIVAAVKAAVPVPVTVKLRKGWDNTQLNAVEVAQICAQAGADAIAIHGRTRQEMYTPPADWNIIRQIKQAVSVPVIGNGDVTTAQQAADMLEQTGCDMVMIGRGALGNPWLFSQINAHLSGTPVPPDPSLQERMQILREHITHMCSLKTEHFGMQQARKHVAWYIKGVQGAAEFRRRSGTLTTLADLDCLIRDILAANLQPAG